MIVRSLQETLNHLRAYTGRGLIVDLDDSIPAHGNHPFYELNAKERGSLNVAPGNEGFVILLVKNFPDVDESSPHVSYVASCVAYAASTLGCREIFINCRGEFDL